MLQKNQGSFSQVLLFLLFRLPVSQFLPPSGFFVKFSGIPIIVLSTPFYLPFAKLFSFYVMV